MTDEILQMISDCENRESKMTEWECEFIQSISEQISVRALSKKQMDTLEKIWERVS
jgi:hypothetical protein